MSHETDVKQVRYNNLKVMISEVGTQAKLSEVAEIDKGYVSLMVTKRRDIGEKMARKLEVALGKPLLWMDIDHSSSSGDQAGHGEYNYDATNVPLNEIAEASGDSHESILQRLREMNAFDLADAPPWSGQQYIVRVPPGKLADYWDKGAHFVVESWELDWKHGYNFVIAKRRDGVNIITETIDDETDLDEKGTPRVKLMPLLRGTPSQSPDSWYSADDVEILGGIVGIALEPRLLGRRS